MIESIIVFTLTMAFLISIMDKIIKVKRKHNEEEFKEFQEKEYQKLIAQIDNGIINERKVRKYIRRNLGLDD